MVFVKGITSDHFCGFSPPCCFFCPNSLIDCVPTCFVMYPWFWSKSVSKFGFWNMFVFKDFKVIWLLTWSSGIYGCSNEHAVVVISTSGVWQMSC